jgi:hypothetical protein
MTLCKYIVRHDGLTAIRCPAFAAKWSEYCPAHQSRPVSKPRPRTRRSRDVDVLPWTDDDRRIFESSARRKANTER